MDAKIKNNMKTFLYKDSQKRKYKIGVYYGNKGIDGGNIHIIILIGMSRIDDFLGANIEYFINYIYKKVMESFSIPHDDVCWYQYYPGYNGFKDTCEEILVDWDDKKGVYKLFMRKGIDRKEITKMIETLETKDIDL